jgi:hypothetical protein
MAGYLAGFSDEGKARPQHRPLIAGVIMTAFRRKFSIVVAGGTLRLIDGCAGLGKG